MPSNKIQAIPLVTFSSASVTSNYQSMNAAGIPAACAMFFITNGSNQNITISYDGTTDHEYVLASSSKPLYFQTLGEPNNKLALMPLGTQIYVKGTAGTGTIAVSAYYV